MTNATLLGSARDLGERLSGMLRSAGAKRAIVVGDARRGLSLVGELVVLACAISPRRAAEAVRESSEAVRRVRSSGGEVVAKLEGAGTVRVRIVREPEWVKSVVQETGDAAHVAWLRACARERGTSFGRVTRSARDERAVYRTLELPYAPPELREGATPSVPRDLLGERGVHGVFHVHTDWSDGTASIVAMAEAARDAGLAYVGISDHSRAAVYAHGLDAMRLVEQAAAIVAARERVNGIEILHGIEVDILLDGTLDLDDATLAKLDFVIASVHTRHNLPAAAMTDRIVRAVSHPLVTMLGHPTGRLLPRKHGYAFDMARVAAAAAANDTYLEINANSHRMDLEGSTLDAAVREGARFAINPDAHATSGFRDTPLGVFIARRAGLSAARVLNALDRDLVVATLRARRAAALERLRSA